MVQARAIDRPPLLVRLMDRVARPLLGAGMPLGPNALLTVRGRRSGVPRSAGVALTEIGGRRWVISAYGDTHWVRNLRAAGEAQLTVRGRATTVRAEELSAEASLAFFRDELLPHLRAQSLPMRLAGRIFVGDILRDPVGAVARHPVFALG